MALLRAATTPFGRPWPRAVIPYGPYVTDRPAALIGVPSITAKRMCHDACTGCLMHRALTLTDRRERGR